MYKLITTLIALAFSLPANACECAFPPLDTQSVREAKHVFIFRLLSAELQPKGSDQPLSTMVVGKIQVIDVLRGTTKATNIRFSTHQCCGTRLDVGKYYAAFTSEIGPELLGNSGNLIEVGAMYYPKSGAGAKIVAVLSGKKSLESVFSEYALDRTQQVPRPPAPFCPTKGQPSS